MIFHSCYDKDTCKFTLPDPHLLIGNKINVRLNGIDTPEIRGKCWREKGLALNAKRRLNEILKKSKRGKYFRIVAGVWADGVEVNEVLINEGYAVRYQGGKKQSPGCK